MCGKFTQLSRMLVRNDLADPFMEQIDMFQQAPKLELNFNEKLIPFKEVRDMSGNIEFPLSEVTNRLWNHRMPDDTGLQQASGRIDNKPNNFFSRVFAKDNIVSNTILATSFIALYDEPRYLNKIENCKIGSYPLDYNFLDNKSSYLIGMSVPPVMVAQIATEIYNQWKPIFKL